MSEFRRIAGGVHRFKLNGKMVSVKPGEIIDCTAEDLGTRIDQYEKVSVSNSNKSPLLREIERLEFLFRGKSIWLNEPVRPDNTTMWRIPPKDLQGLQNCLLTKNKDMGADGISGELPIMKSQLREFWRQWNLKVVQDPLGRLDPHQPKDQYLERIAQAQAQVNILELEIKEIERRIKAVGVPHDAVKEDQTARLRFKGHSRCNKDHKMIWCDGRAVKYDKDDKPVFADDGKSVASYLEECKEYQLKQSERKKAEAAKKARRQPVERSANG